MWDGSILTRMDRSVLPSDTLESMTLHVDFDHFVEAVQRHAKGAIVYAARLENRTHLTAADPAANVIISSSTKSNLDEAKALLTTSGLDVRHGGWEEHSRGPGDSLGELPYVAAVSYKSGDELPGVWIDAYGEPPSPATVLKAIYDEFRETGEVGNMSFEEFVRLANPNVAIASPSDLERYLGEKGCEEPTIQS